MNVRDGMRQLRVSKSAACSIHECTMMARTMTDFFFCAARSVKLLDRFSFHTHSVRPLSSAGISDEEAMAAYVVQTWSAPSDLLRDTDGPEKEVVGPSVCEMMGCSVDS